MGAANHAATQSNSEGAVTARIYKPAKSAMQSGIARTKEWVVEHEPAIPREIDPLMGWTSSADTRAQVRLEFDTKAAESRIAEGSLGDLRIAIARPQTFMNDSGRAVAKLLDRYRLSPDALLVVFDEIDLPLGKVRLRERGGPGTHNGMRSITGEIGEGFPRLRIGVAPTDPTVEIDDLAEYVLSPFAADERATADQMIARGAEAAEVAVRDGVKRAMDTFNG